MYGRQPKSFSCRPFIEKMMMKKHKNKGTLVFYTTAGEVNVQLFTLVDIVALSLLQR